jgi:hypothetical protein
LWNRASRHRAWYRATWNRTLWNWATTRPVIRRWGLKRSISSA